MSVNSNNINQVSTTRPIGRIVQARTTTVPSINSAEQQAFDDQDFTDFAAIGASKPGTSNYMNDVAKTINKYVDYRGSAPYSGNQQPLSENVGDDISKVPYREKMLQNISQKALGIAKQMGIKNAAEFKANADLILSRAGGEDYKFLKENKIMYNLPDGLSRLYEDKLKSYKPAKDRYDYDRNTGKLVPKGETPTPTTNIETMIQGELTKPNPSTKTTKEIKTIKLKVPKD